MRLAQRTRTGLPRQRTTDAAPRQSRAIRQRRYRIAAPLAAAVAVGAVALALATNSHSNTDDATGNVFAQARSFDASAEAQLIAAGPAAALPLTDGDWRLDSVVVEPSWFTGNFAGTAELSYTGTAPAADAAFGVGLYQGSAYVGRLTGTVHSLAAGGHAIVSLSSIDAYEAGQYHYGFRNAQ
jgi:hypothetical protein